MAGDDRGEEVTFSYVAPTNNLVVLWAKTAAKYSKFTAAGSPDLTAAPGAGTGHCLFTAAQWLAAADLMTATLKDGKFPLGGKIATTARKVGLSYDNKFRVPLFKSLRITCKSSKYERPWETRAFRHLLPLSIMSTREVGTHRIADVEQMAALGEKIARKCRAGDLILLNGPLGAGKTVFVQGVGRALGISDVTSPTFVISRIHQGALPLIHVDVYRLLEAGNAAAYLDDLDLDTAREDGLTVIEWGGAESARLSDDRLEIDIDRTNDERVVTIQAPVGSRWDGVAAMTVSLSHRYRHITNYRGHCAR